MVGQIARAGTSLLSLVSHVWVWVVQFAFVSFAQAFAPFALTCFQRKGRKGWRKGHKAFPVFAPEEQDVYSHAVSLDDAPLRRSEILMLCSHCAPTERLFVI
jgi:hypothetical protein